MTRPDKDPAAGRPHPGDGLGQRLQDLLSRELRAAVSAQIEGGADPGRVKADLDRRLRSLREMRRGTTLDLDPSP